MDQQYFDLLLCYLEFFLPFRVISDIPSTPNKQKNIKQPEILDDSCIFKCNAIENLGQALNTAQFFIESLIEMWTGQNDYDLLESPGLKVPVYIKPNQYVVKSISILVKRLVDMDLSQINGDPSSRMYFDRNSASHVVYEINKAQSYKLLSIKLFRFLCNAMQHWPNDDSIADIIDLWIMFAFPWKKDTNVWSSFVQENFLYYTKLLQLFVVRCLSFDFYGSARPILKKNVPASKYLSIIEKVMECFDDYLLVETVRSIEHALLSLKSYARWAVLCCRPKLH